jgi:hypothetical protein
VAQDLRPGDLTMARLLLSISLDMHESGLHLESERYCRQALAMLTAPGAAVPPSEQARATWLLAEVSSRGGGAGGLGAG